MTTDRVAHESAFLELGPDGMSLLSAEECCTPEGIIIEEEEEPATPQTSVSQARAMGYDAETIADLQAQGLLSDDAPWRPTTLDDLNFLVAKHAEYEAEEERLTTQYQRRLKNLAKRREWLARYNEDAAEVLKAHLPRVKSGKSAGEFAAKSLDLEDGRVCLRTKGGGYEVNEKTFVDTALANWPFETDTEPLAIQCIRACRTEKLTGALALSTLAAPMYGDSWQAEVLKQPILAYLKAHPDALMPGVSALPTREEFVIEKRKKEKSDEGK